MKVKELIEKLKEFDPDMDVMVNDSEFGLQEISEVKTGKHYYSGNQATECVVL